MRQHRAARRPACSAYLHSGGSTEPHVHDRRRRERGGEPSPGTAFVRGLAALDGGTLLTVAGTTVYASGDGGCTWQAGGSLPRIAKLASGGGVAYAWEEFLDAVYAVDARGAVTRRALPAGETRVVGLGADGARVRIGTASGRLYASRDGGATWQASGQAVSLPAGSERNVYRVAFDPDDLDRALLSQFAVPAETGTGLWRTENGGDTWTLTAFAGRAPYEVTFAPEAAGRASGVVWAFGRGADDVNALYRSGDLGATFEAVASAAPEAGVFISNGPTHTPDASDPSAIYWSQDELFRGVSTLFRYDHGTGEVASETRASALGTLSLLTVPERPGTVYIGLAPGASD